MTQLFYCRCGKKERLIILNPENPNDNVDDLVRMIEGGGKMSNDPRKLAKKARQKEKKVGTNYELYNQKELIQNYFLLVILYYYANIK